MTTVIFVRHGESQSNILIHQDPNDPDLSDKLNMIGDPHLTIKGHKQADVLGEYLSKQLGTKSVRVLTSLFTRTQQTSKPFCDMHSKYIMSNDCMDLLSEYTKPEKKLTEEHFKRGLKNHQKLGRIYKNSCRFCKNIRRNNRRNNN